MNNGLFVNDYFMIWGNEKYRSTEICWVVVSIDLNKINLLMNKMKYLKARRDFDRWILKWEKEDDEVLLDVIL